MDDLHENVANREKNIQFLSAFSYECLLFCFTLFDFAANEFPQKATRLVRRALADHEFIALPDKGGNYFNHIYYLFAIIRYCSNSLI